MGVHHDAFYFWLGRVSSIGSPAVARYGYECLFFFHVQEFCDFCLLAPPPHLLPLSGIGDSASGADGDVGGAVGLGDGVLMAAAAVAVVVVVALMKVESVEVTGGDCVGLDDGGGQSCLRRGPGFGELIVCPCCLPSTFAYQELSHVVGVKGSVRVAMLFWSNISTFFVDCGSSCTQHSR